MEECIFCKIAQGKIPSAKVYEDDKVIAFLDIAPNNKGHCLVVPRAHSEDLLRMNEEDLSSIMGVSQKVAKALTKAFDCHAFNLIMNNGKEAGQVVFHSHIHVIPRFENDGIKFAARHLNYEGNEKAECAERIKKLI